MSEYEEQANDFLEEIGATMECKYEGFRKYFPDDKHERDVWTVILAREDGYLDVTYGQSIANENKKPTAYDVLSCLTKSDPGTFENFCSEFGYDTDSIKANRIYRNVKAEWLDVSDFFTDYELKELREIQ